MTNTDTNKTLTIEGIHFQTKKPISIQVQNGIISKIQTNIEKFSEDLPIIGPGLVDLQINGYEGLDFNTLPIDDSLVPAVTRALWKEGVTSYCPTVITNNDELIEEAMRAIAKAYSQDSYVRRAIAGIHLEGPFISPKDGPRGAHSKAYVKGPDWSLFQRWQDAAEGKIKIVTLSPEWPGASKFIERCVDNDVIVSIGHTAATSKQIREAVDAGARMSTHLGNGAHLMLPRHPNYIWEQLSQDELWACVIADGFHLPDSMLKVIIRTKGSKVMLVSDAVYLSGMPSGNYNSHIGGEVVLTPKGKLHLADNPKLLAGSAQMLTWGIRHLVKSKLMSLSEAWEMASMRPASFIGFPCEAGLKVGAPADLIAFTSNEDGIDIIETYKNGEIVYSKRQNELVV
ncbi:amidohydrolase family protein [Peribacillus butanolivorans]|uniref:N-acetylglucosamine-6-phosphate deacetylase n=1 Tax=Peribacillus butanolivorans TaxID=421767 RepID=UPI00207C5EB7|nr:amidohydrolase family protein [Peribacillus butanolivorans]MCO0598477.1 amidohydrolase family protein [Peribacillus butanolivorans]